MDEQIFSKVVTEVSSFYRAVTTPFLNRMSDDDREKAVLWSQKVMDLKNYESLTKYLTYLSFMIINGRLVTPFDIDPNTSQIPPLPVHVGETKMLDFIEKVVAQCQSVQNNQNGHSTAGEITAAVSSDEFAFLSTQPTPGVGIRMYLATSAQPFSMWSKADGTPQATKYNVPAREVIDRGLSLAKEKFYSYLDEIEKMNKRNGTGLKCARCQRSANGNTTQDTTSSEEDLSDISFDFGSLNETGGSLPRNGNRSRPTQGVTQAQSRTGADSGTPCRDAVPGSSGTATESASVPKKYGGYKSRPPDPLSEDDKKRETEVDEKYERWFEKPEYDHYREQIKGFIRGGTKIDTIRRAIHSHVRENYNRWQDVPFHAYDSEDESLPKEIRVTHLRVRYIDVLEKEYGIQDEAELYYLLGLMGLSEKNMQKARELIKYAEDGLIDDDFRRRFRAHQGRSCGRLITIIEELLRSARESAGTSGTSIPSTQTTVPASTSQATVPPISQTPLTGGSSRPSIASLRHPRGISGSYKIKGMPPTSTMDDHSDVSDPSNQSNIQNEPEPEFFSRIEEIDNDTSNESANRSNTNGNTSTSTTKKPNQPDSEPDGSVYPYCPKDCK